MATYRYQPLQGPRSTRLIWLEQAKVFSSPLNCRLFEVLLDQTPQYEALSYSWGGQVRDRPILCSNMTLQITANCEAALRHLRLPSGPRTLWVDSICIDQSSIADKNQQIPNMREIYQRAVEVLVWVGEADARSDLTIRLLTSHSKAALYPSIEHSRDGNVDLPTTGLKLLATATSWLILLVLVKPCLMVCGGLRSNEKHSAVKQEGGSAFMFNFFARSVFERMWCVQEIAMAREARVICGTSSLTWDQMVAALRYSQKVQGIVSNMELYQRHFEDRIALQEMLRNIIYPKPTKTPSPWPSMSSLLDTTRSRGAEEPRDKVYALSGIFQLMRVNLPVQDYSKPVRQVYHEITQITIACDGKLDILYQLTGLPNGHQLPSWVPDFSNTKPPAIPMHQAFHATKGSLPHWRILESHNGLCLVGIVLDRVKVRGRVLDPPNAPTAGSDAMIPSAAESSRALDTFKEWLSIGGTLTTYPTQQPVLDAFGRALITNSVIHAKANLSRMLEVYRAWHEIVTAATSADELLEQGISNMLDDVSALPVTAHEQQEFALQLVAALLVRIIEMRTSVKKRARIFHHWLSLTLKRKAFFVTQQGYMGIAPDSVAEGDALVLLSGSTTPFLAREMPGPEARGLWKLVAPVYVEGMMYGELWNENARLDEFVFV